MTTNNSNNHDHSDNLGLKFNYDMLANAAILHAIGDLEHDALNDEGVMHWVDAFGIDPNIIHHGIDTMPLNKNGMPDAKPAIRRIMETLDAREPITNLVEVEVAFGHTPVANMDIEPDNDELAEIENEVIEIE
jgi:hypothetical protein